MPTEPSPISPSPIGPSPPPITAFPSAATSFPQYPPRSTQPAAAPPPPPIDYRSTADRPAWQQLPLALRAAVEQRLGAPVVTATTASSGFTRGFAAVLATGTGDRAFVKAADLAHQHHLAECYYHEVLVTQALPAAVPAPRPRWAATAGGWYAVCFEAIDGDLPRLPLPAKELAATLDAWARAAHALRKPPAQLVSLCLPRLADLLRADMSWWQQAPPLDLDHVDELATLEAALPGYVDTASLTHCDLRPDNVLIDRSGTAWLCDWNWICHGTPWFDTAGLLIYAYASGLDADRLFAEHPTAAGAPPEALDASLAAMSGYLLGRAATAPAIADPADAAGEFPADAPSAAIRAHHLWSGRAALAWLSARRGWRRSGWPG